MESAVWTTRMRLNVHHCLYQKCQMGVERRLEMSVVYDTILEKRTGRHSTN